MRAGLMQRVSKPAAMRSVNPQVGRTLAPAIEDQQLMAGSARTRQPRNELPRPCQSGHGNNHMNEQDDEVAHPGNGNNTSQAHRIQANLPIRHGQVRRAESPAPLRSADRRFTPRTGPAESAPPRAPRGSPAQLRSAPTSFDSRRSAQPRFASECAAEVPPRRVHPAELRFGRFTAGFRHSFRLQSLASKSRVLFICHSGNNPTMKTDGRSRASALMRWRVAL